MNGRSTVGVRGARARAAPLRAKPPGAGTHAPRVLLRTRLRNTRRDAGDVSEHASLLQMQRQVGNRAVQRLVASTLHGTGHRSIQRFGSQEHQSLGDTAAGATMVDVGSPTASFELSHGDVIALTGDYFLADDLMRVAAIPGDRGTRAGTRDEIVWALKVIDDSHDDPRFAAGGRWAGFNFSDPVKQAVDVRYNALAAANASHFYAPMGRDASGQAVRSPTSGASAFGSYRELHERALSMAYTAAATPGRTMSHAMAMEAAAQHYLTDSFSAGHLRTPIASIRSYWSARYPLFWYNLLHKMALDTAIRMNDIDTNATTIIGTVQQMYEGVLAQVMGIAASLPPVGLGDLLGLLFHDFDNEMGLDVAGGRVYGDSHLDEPNPANLTRPIAQDAILAGMHDVREAFALGGSLPGLADAEVFQAVRAATHAPADRYVAESRIPVPDPGQAAQNWQAADFESLWSQPMAGTRGATVGDRIRMAMRPGDTIRSKLDNLATSFPLVDRRGTGNLHPQRAYLEGFVAPLVADPRAGLLSVIHWAPNYGLRDSDRDDVSLASGRELESGGQLAGMTTPARAAYVRELIGGRVRAEEESMVVAIFRAAPADQRRRVYQLVEGHAWSGDWIHGITVSDDDIWNALSSSNLATLRLLIDAP